MKRLLYSDMEIREASIRADSVTDVMRRLNMRITGGSHGHLKRRMLSIGIDIASMAKRGRASNAGKSFPHKRRNASNVLVLRLSGRRQYYKYLKRALLEIGRPYACEGCGNSGTWMGKPLVLQVDHIDENWLDDRAQNLRFVCPNCHANIKQICLRGGMHTH
jgi:predicted RNA-binding Zn-ribbon protein involved in translation (DUF1610 family)